ncbi:hydrogen gas-evolving membrane-bound hydrogenase subunit E [Halocatena marina]|uniref:Hydrogen gas-evolving membrane-bound hydrogenase subunit E n=1 Tax=Halocatena marina TaxID=2934937 RepID=A0ABD5YQ27_9EURY
MQPDPAILLSVLAIPFVGAAMVPLVYRLLGERTAYFAAGIAMLCFVLLLSQYENWGTVTVNWIPSLGVSLVLYLDGLAYLIALLASGVGVLVFVYSGGYMHGEPGRMKYYAALLAFMGSMLGVALVVDLISLFVFWELTSVASFILIGHYQRTPSSLYAARKSMLITVSGGLFMLVGFLILHLVSGQALGGMTFTLIGTEQSLIGIPGEVDNAAAIRGALHSAGLFIPVLVLLAIGAATKSAQVPFHIWLPNAMEAPTPVSAFLHSATMVKAGVYLIGRFRPLFVPEHVVIAEGWTLLFVALGLATMTIAAILAVGAVDIKELLAYSTASHLGLIVAGFGFAEVIGGEAGVFHILNHASFKAALFLIAGIIAHEAGTRSIADLGGLRRDLPVTAIIAVIASLSMAGVPPFNGFYSKEFLFDAAWETAAQTGGVAWVFPVVAVFGSVFTFLYSVRFIMLFFGERPEELGEVHRPPLSMLAPVGVLGLLVLGISISPQTAFNLLVGDAIGSTMLGEHHFKVYFPTKVTPPVLMSTITIVTGLLAYSVYDRLHNGIRRVRSIPPVTANYYYDSTIEGLGRWSNLVPRYVQTRILRTYAAVVLLSVSAIALGGYVVGGAGVSLAAPTLAAPIIIILCVAVVGAIAVSVAPSHIAGVLTLSIVGFMVAVFYVLASAPDLALTQLVIETLVLVIFLLVLDKLPEYYGELKRSRAVVDGLIAGAVGVTVALTVLLTTAAHPNDSIAHFFLERAPVPPNPDPVFVDWGGGGNIVNVILVDFRAFDTMGEISVVAMAALAVLTLIGMRNRGESA